MKKTCSKCCREFAHASSLCRHRKSCGGGTRLPCPYCSTTFGRADDLKRHVARYCKQRPTTTHAISVQQVEPGTKRAAEHTFDPSEDAKLHEIPKRRLVDYESSSDEEEVDRALAGSLGRMEQLGGALEPLFRFQLERIGQRRRCREIVDRMQFHATLHQLRPSGPRDNIGLSLMEAIHEAIRTQITTLDNVTDHDRLHFAIQAHEFVHAFCSVDLEVGEFLHRSAYLNDLLETLASKLKSNEHFDPQRGFQLDVVVVRMPRSV